jgi:hypothetical protein
MIRGSGLSRVAIVTPVKAGVTMLRLITTLDASGVPRQRSYSFAIAASISALPRFPLGVSSMCSHRITPFLSIRK